MRTDSALSFVDVLLTENVLTQNANGLPLSLILVQGEPLPGGVGPGLRMEAVTSINNPHPFTVAASSTATAGEIYTDRQISVLDLSENPDPSVNTNLTPRPSRPLTDLDLNTTTPRFISERTAWFVSRSEVRTG